MTFKQLEQQMNRTNRLIYCGLTPNNTSVKLFMNLGSTLYHITIGNTLPIPIDKPSLEAAVRLFNEKVSTSTQITFVGS